VLRIDTDVALDEVQFQPGVFLVKAGLAREEILRRDGVPTAPPARKPITEDGETSNARPTAPAPGAERTRQGIESVRLKIRNVPADKMRDVIKVAILPFAASGARVESSVEVTAEASEAGIPRETLDLTVLEGLRQLGLDVDVEIDGKES
jgi:hypothetical protein